MRQLVYLVAVSLDGYIAKENGDFSSFPQTGDHIDALLEEWPETLPGPMLVAAGITPRAPRFDAVVMGWNTYALAHDHGLLDPYPTLETVVCSRTRSGEGLPVAVASNARAAVDALKAKPGRDIWLCGGGQLAGALFDRIDRLVLKINPVALGRGIPLFGQGGELDAAFSLVSVRPFESGVVMGEYVRARN